MKNLLSSLAVATTLLLSSTSFAATVSGDSSGIFTNPVKQSSSTWYSGVNSSVFSYGKGPSNKIGASALAYKGNEFKIEKPSQKFKIGTLGFLNGTSYVGTSVDSVDLEVNVDFYDLTDQEISFDLNLDQTLNSLNPADDFVFLPAPFTSDEVFTIDGAQFTFMAIFGEFVDGVFSPVSQLQVPEQKIGSVGLYGMFTPVPVPAAFWLFGSALATLLVTRRKASV